MKYLLAIIASILIFGCTIAPLEKTTIHQTPFEVESKSKSIAVSGIVDALPRGKVVGKAYRGLGCFSNGELHWGGSEKRLADISNSVRTRLNKYHYSLVGKAYSPFNEEYAKRADLLLGGKLLTCNRTHAIQ